MEKAQKLKLIYRHTHRDYKGRMNGVPTILVLRTGGTTLVSLDALTDAEIEDKLPYALSSESRRLTKKGN